MAERLGDRPVKVDLPADLPLVSVDPVILEQLFVNLLENAVKYTPPGSPLEIDARAANGSIIVEVMDHGPGLPHGSEEKVFEKFFRGSHAGVSGAGLGLPICRGIAEAHGGTITAENRPGGGALFRVTLPIPAGGPSMPEPMEPGP
jgi:two-component system sensor histidine kinase KdpD